MTPSRPARTWFATGAASGPLTARAEAQAQAQAREHWEDVGRGTGMTPGR
ncbi:MULTISPECIES: hypothetical protein [Streptomyces]|uniref:Uncharacterized protein n=1 Tax=Streptomyces evansiae TaxID=3075535 RepID=A0ABU2QWM1_9ACTN|nr:MULTISPECIES: hypothetical protein [unclassified Streptomyces]MDT0408487.1 hypothetical protein [Streptomyces sp. DSM 41979]MDT0422305.1 hypothetical protein [Streptomyces sp. DSM 41859]MYQ56673.1 hypothetical protein [Streptomyces sp. SID4926]SCE60309.1 hypothetical protein GA0115252_18016 [Streptomyces sp. DfronAA-171]